MIKNVLLGISLVVTLWFLGRAGSGLWCYWQLEASAPAHVHKIKVCQLSESSYKLKVYYTFLQGKVRGSMIMGTPYYMNRSSAEKAAERMKGQFLQAYYDPSKPSHSSLEKKFPWKDILYSVMGLGVTFYFLGLRRYVENLSKSL
jgi:hypothetical protein